MKILKSEYSYYKDYLNSIQNQNEEQNVGFHQSQFVYSEVLDGKEYLYHFLTGELLLIESYDDKSQNENYLKAHQYLVPDNFDEYKFAERFKFYCREKYKVQDGWNNYTIFTTTFCNARCFYCYEKNAKKESMTIDTADKAIDFMLQHRNGKPLYLTWFGGEPLVNVAVIEHTCSKLSSMNIEYYGDMHSNGYLFDKTMIERAVNLWRLKTVRITIDGLYENYKSVKNYVNNDPNPLNKVLSNIDDLVSAGIHVQIRLHIDKYNFEEIGDLVSLICKRYGHNPLVDAYIHLLFIGHEHNSTVHEDKMRMSFLDKADEYEKLLVDHDLLKYELDDNFKFYACRADRENVIDVLPNGNLIKCRDYLSGPILGNVNCGNRINQDLLQEWKKRYKDFEVCKMCMLYPTCGRLKLCSERENCDIVYRQLKLQKVTKAIKYQYFMKGIT